jgi:hypothetical protein
LDKVPDAAVVAGKLMATFISDALFFKHPESLLTNDRQLWREMALSG